MDARPLGANHNLCVSVTGIKDRFALEGEALTREYAALALGTAFHPYFVGGVFDPEAVTIEKQMLKKALEDEIDEKRIYCQRQANREFFGRRPAGIRQEGYLDEVDGLTPETLTEAYREMLPHRQHRGRWCWVKWGSGDRAGEAGPAGRAFPHRAGPSAIVREPCHAPAGCRAQGGML